MELALAALEQDRATRATAVLAWSTSGNPTAAYPEHDGPRHPCGPPAPPPTPWPRDRKRSPPCPAPPVDVFELGAEHEQVVFANDPASGLRAIIAIHSTALGPALGGTRFYPYASTDDAVRDVLNLSRGMSYKAALAGLDLGGGKAVIIGDPATR